MPASNVVSFSTLRARSYVFRLPLFTRAVLLAIVGFWIVSVQSVWDVRTWGALIPDELGITTCSSPALCCGLVVWWMGGRMGRARVQEMGLAS